MIQVTPYSEALEVGQYEIVAHPQVIVGGKNYAFDSWEDGSTSNTKLINLNADTIITINYSEVTNVANVTFNVILSAQLAPTPITIKVTIPDNTVETLPAVNTNIGGICTVNKEYLPGSYFAEADAPADARYKAVTSGLIPFTVGLEDRTIDLTVVVG